MSKLNPQLHFQTHFFLLREILVSPKAIFSCSIWLISSIKTLFWTLALTTKVKWIRGCQSFSPLVFPSDLLSFHPSVPMSGSFLRICSLVFSETQHGVRGPCDLVRDRAGFFEKKNLCPKSGPKIRFFLNLVHNEILYYLLYSCSNPIFGKNLVPEIWVKMHVDTNSWKLKADGKVFGWAWSKMGAPSRKQLNFRIPWSHVTYLLMKWLDHVDFFACRQITRRGKTFIPSFS